MLDPKLKDIVDKQLPEFVREDYPRFNAFIKAYFEYLDLADERNLEELRDIDNTLYDYIIFINSELGFSNTPNATIANVDPRLFLRKSKSIFRSKGTEETYRFLFRTLFNKLVDISYPWDLVLKTSDGKWKQDLSIFVNVTNGDINTIIGEELIISGTNRIIKVYSERYEFIRGNIYEIFINKNYFGNIQIGDTVTATNFNGVIIPTTVSYSVVSGGSGYKVGDLIEGSTVAGALTINQLLKVTKVSSTGGIVKLQTVKFGAGYSDDFFLMTAKQTIAPSNSTITIDLNSTPQFNLPDNSVIDKYTDFGFIINPNYYAITYTDPTYAGVLLREFYTETPNVSGDNPNFALIRFNVGAVAKYQGYYIANDGFLDDAIKLQDSKYYQKYSYLLTVDESLYTYESYLKSFIHPAGTALFGEYQIQNTYAPGLTAVINLDQYTSKATFNNINKSFTNEYVSVTDFGTIRINPYDLEQYSEIDYNPATIQTFTG